MSYVLVVDTKGRPCNPVWAGDARVLLKEGRAAVLRRFPFTIILKTESTAPIDPHVLKFDPGSKTTGVAVVNPKTGRVVFAAEINHRGEPIHESMTSRRSLRRSRRNRKTRYRAPRFDNRKRAKGTLPPSLESRVKNIITWARRLIKVCPISLISMELVKFDMQLLCNPEIQGVEYQQGTAYGYEVREYLLDKFKRTCVYCGIQKVRFEIDHIVPKSRGGSNRVTNLALSCSPCNLKKGSRTALEFGHPDVQKQANSPLKDAAAVNSTKKHLHAALLTFGLPVETGTGGRTKFNRLQQNLEKKDWIDAACVGASTPARLIIKDIKPLLIFATGHGSRQMTRVDRYGFPRTGPKQSGKSYGFKTGDMVKACVPTGKHKGTHTGKVAVRATGFFNITTAQEVKQGIKHSYCKLIHAIDGYRYIV